MTTIRFDCSASVSALGFENGRPFGWGPRAVENGLSVSYLLTTAPQPDVEDATELHINTLADGAVTVSPSVVCAVHRIGFRGDDGAFKDPKLMRAGESREFPVQAGHMLVVKAV
jgi:hypothetical protein